jgi:plastocyanin
MESMSASRKVVALFASAVMAVALTACSDDDSSTDDSSTDDTTATTSASGTTDTTASSAAGETVEVDIKNFVFSPATLNVKVGQTVKWTNNDSATHTVTSGANRTSDGKFDKTLAPGESYEWTFKAAGTVDYYCKPHQNMNAKVVVS